MHLRLLHIAFLSLTSLSLFAQDYKYEIGAGGGTASYMGDANKSSLFKNMGPAAGIVLRYNVDYRWAVKANMTWANVSGSTRGVENVFPDDAQLSFDTDLYDLGGQLEFNFFPYSDKYDYLNTERLTPYLMLGLGLTVAPGDNRTFSGLNIPVGVGAKYKLEERLNLVFELSFRKLFGDGLEGVDMLDDPYELNRSRMKNNDWYSMAMLSVTWDFGQRCVPCNNKNTYLRY